MEATYKRNIDLMPSEASDARGRLPIPFVGFATGAVLSVGLWAFLALLTWILAR